MTLFCSLLIEGDPREPIYDDSETVVNLEEGSSLNVSCIITIMPSMWLYAYATKNLSASFDDLQDDHGSHATCSGTDYRCRHQFNSSVTNITVSRYGSGGCPPVQVIKFTKNKVSVKEDNGTKIICAFEPNSNDPKTPYAYIYLNISLPGPNHPSSQASLSVIISTTVVSIIVVVTVALTVAACAVWWKRKHHRGGEPTILMPNMLSEAI